jgi:ribosomal protein S18 acetylase RimI-like enzyme
VKNISITPERPDTTDAAALVAELDAYLIPLYPPASHHGMNVDQLVKGKVAFFVLRCGGLQFFDDEYSELKRLYIRPSHRGNGLGKILLRHLEAYSRAQKISVVRLETGILQHEAISLYEKSGYRRIPPFGPYTEDPLSIFYEKRLA